MSAIKEVERITYKELRPGNEFWIVREKNDLSLLKIQGVWQIEVLEVLLELKIAKVKVIFPQTGHEEITYFEMAAVGESLKIYFNPEKTSYFFDDNIVSIVVL